jgi:hypothetical protein
MKSTKLFRTIWRINSVLILTVGLMSFGLLAYIGYELYKQKFQTRDVSEVVNVDSDAYVNSEWALGGFSRVEGTNYLMAPAFSKQNYQVSYYEKGASAVRNYLFVNAVDKSSRWLIPDNKALFLSSDRLSQGDVSNKPMQWMKYEVIKADTNQDKRLTEKDQRAIAISSLTGEGYVELVKNIDELLGSQVQDENTLLLFYRSGQKRFVSEINLPKRQVTVTKELPSI